jgi:hypothetical protein
MATTRAPTKAQRGKPAQPTAGSRVDIIRTVQTPLGFFVLVVLVVEAIIGGVAGFSGTRDRPYIISIMAGIVILLVVMVTALALFRPEALQGQRAPNMAVIRVQEPELPIIKSPRVLIAATELFTKEDMGFESDIEAVHLLGGSTPNIARNVTSEQLRDLMVRHQFDIVHLLVYVRSEERTVGFFRE